MEPRRLTQGFDGVRRPKALGPGPREPRATSTTCATCRAGAASCSCRPTRPTSTRSCWRRRSRSRGFPPVIYGAGKNLFTNPIISFFMHNLGAYRVDRRIRVSLYKDVLKLYSQVMIERGYHSRCFFRAERVAGSGMIEKPSQARFARLGGRSVHHEPNSPDRPAGVVRADDHQLRAGPRSGDADPRLADRRGSRPATSSRTMSSPRSTAGLRSSARVVGMRGACIIRFGEPIDPFRQYRGRRDRSIGHAHRAGDRRRADTSSSRGKAGGQMKHAMPRTPASSARCWRSATRRKRF